MFSKNREHPEFHNVNIYTLYQYFEESWDAKNEREYMKASSSSDPEIAWTELKEILKERNLFAYFEKIIKNQNQNCEHHENYSGDKSIFQIPIHDETPNISNPHPLLCVFRAKSILDMITKKTEAVNHSPIKTIAHDEELIAVLQGAFESNPDLETECFLRINESELSSYNKNANCIASLAITILNALKFDMSGLNFKGVYIPNAYLANGNFERTNFSGADLSDVDFSDSADQEMKGSRISMKRDLDEEFETRMKQNCEGNSNPPDGSSASPEVHDCEQSHMSVEETPEIIYEQNTNPRGRIKKAKSTQIWPYAAFGRLELTNKNSSNDSLVGTGTLIGSKLVLTAAHNFTKKINEIVTLLPLKDYEIEFISSLNAESSSPKSIKVEKVYLPKEYTGKNPSKDFALLVLSKEISYKTGYLGIHGGQLTEKSIEAIKKKNCKIYGYPAGFNHHLAGMEGPIKEINEGFVYYDKINTEEGQSGAAVCYEQNEQNEQKCKYYIIGIHIGYHKISKMNVARRLSSEVINQLYQWIEDYESSRAPLRMKLECCFSEKPVIGEIFNNGLDELTHLKLTDRKISPINIQKLIINIRWENLTILDLSHNSIGNKGVELLAKANWPSLWKLKLTDNNIDNHGATALSTNTTWDKLCYLDLSDNEINWDGILIIYQNKVWGWKLKIFKLLISKKGNSQPALNSEVNDGSSEF